MLWDMGCGAAIVIFFAATVARGRLGRNGLLLTHYGGPKPQSGHYIKGFYVTHKNCVFALGAMLASLPVHRESKQVMRGGCQDEVTITMRSEEHTSELQSLMRISYADFCLKKKNRKQKYSTKYTT